MSRSADPVRYSLLVATKNRASRLPAFVAALRPFEVRRDWELVFVDNGSDDDSVARLTELTSALLVPVRILRADGGKSRALNVGLQAATGAIIVFTDDDCYLEPGYFEALDEIFERPEIGFCGGRILLHDPGDARMTIRESPDPVFLPPRSYVAPGLIQGANMALRREVLAELSGFDENLGPGTPFVAEDIDVVARASWKGWAGGYFPKPAVRHHHGRKPGPGLDAAMMSYRRGCGAYFAKFLLHAPSRRMFARQWYWRLRFERTRRHRRVEVAGAIRYLCRGGVSKWRP